ncbi:MAG: transposase [Phycisphaeraceae bacterium]|nr:transposase [Phycisphaeraceae bacterium]
MKHWTLTSLRDKRIKIGTKVTHHSRLVVFQLAKVAVPSQLFRAILYRIDRLRLLFSSPK